MPLIYQKAFSMLKKVYLFILFVFPVLFAKAQIGGEYTYEFLELTNSARIGGGNSTGRKKTNASI